MADNTKIEWTEATWNPITGCSVHSAGCTNCYAMKLAGTRLQHHHSRAGLTKPSKAGPVWTGEVRFNEQWLTQPLQWKRPRMIFVCAHADLFHENVPDEWIDRIFAVMALCPQHTFQVLTKRSDRMREYLNNRAPLLARFMIDEYLIKGSENAKLTGRSINVAWPVQSIGDINDPEDVTMRQWPLPNVWLGVSVENQAAADERIPDLLATSAAVRWISAEPLLGPVDLTQSIYRGDGGISMKGFLRDKAEPDDFHYWGTKLDWVVAGGESGSGARPMHPDWARSLRDQCAAAGTPFFFKQWGEWEVALDRERDDPDWRKNYSTDYVDRGKSKWLNIEGGCGFHGARFHVMRHVGKKTAGRLLDGVEHNGMPAS